MRKSVERVTMKIMQIIEKRDNYIIESILAVQETTILAKPQKQQYLRFENNEWGKVLPSYVKIV